MGDDAGDTSDSVWMTYRELAAARGITVRSAVRLAQRHKWHRQAGNDGTARVLVPTSDAASPPSAAPVARDGAVRDTARAITALEEALFTLRQQLERERARADAAEARAAALASPARMAWVDKLIRAIRRGPR